MKELENCPFCGLENAPVAWNIKEDWFNVTCPNQACEAEGPVTDSYQEAEKMWNTRATTKREAELMRVLKGLLKCVDERDSDNIEFMPYAPWQQAARKILSNHKQQTREKEINELFLQDAIHKQQEAEHDA